ncbi:hypothetical protein [Priestia aryabhattai]
MEVEVSFVPESWISKYPDAGGYFPFAIDGTRSYVVDFIIDAEESNNFISNWMLQLNEFPIYVYVEIFEFQTEEFEHDCKLHNIEYKPLKIKKANDYAYKAIIKNSEQFNALFPHLDSAGSMNNLVLWSLQKDVFTFKQKEYKTLFGIRNIVTPTISMSKDSTVFWIGYDGQNIVALSNNKKFLSINSIRNQFPPKTNVVTIQCEEE